MNNEAMLRLADVLETIEPEAFDMSTWCDVVPENICGAAACVAGWAVLSNPAADERSRQCSAKNITFNYMGAGATILGLTEHEAATLFTSTADWEEWLDELGVAHKDYLDLEDITAKHAVEVLRGLARGEIAITPLCTCDDPDCERWHG